MASAMSSASMSSVLVKTLPSCSHTSDRTWLASSVLTAPGSTTDTRRWRRVNSWRIDSVNAPTPNLVRLYTPEPDRATRPATATAAPSSARARAVAAPIPLLAPVTRATVPSRRCWLMQTVYPPVSGQPPVCCSSRCWYWFRLLTAVLARLTGPPTTPWELGSILAPGAGVVVEVEPDDCPPPPHAPRVRTKATTPAAAAAFLMFRLSVFGRRHLSPAGPAVDWPRGWRRRDPR